MKNSYWFKHDSDAMDDSKCVLLIDQLGMEGYGIYWAILETLRKQPEHKYSAALLPSLARRCNTTVEKMKAVITAFGLFVCEEDGAFYSASMIERMREFDQSRAKRSEAGRLGNEKRWAEHRRIVLASQCDSNAIAMQSQCNRKLSQKRREEKRKEDIKETISKEIAKKEEEIDLENFTGADAPLSARQEPPRPKAESVEWVRRMFNEVCVDYPKVVSLSETRKAKIHIRLEEMRKIAPEKDVLSAILAKMQGSKFLKGDNHRGWKATFDWLIENPTNWVKVYEGNYDDRTASRPAPGRGGPDNHRVNDIWD